MCGYSSQYAGMQTGNCHIHGNRVGPKGPVGHQGPQGEPGFLDRPVGVEVKTEGDTIRYEYCSKSRWNNPDCMPGILKEFEYICRNGQDITLAVLFYHSKHVLVDRITKNTLNILSYPGGKKLLTDLEHPDLIKRIEIEFGSLELDELYWIEPSELFHGAQVHHTAILSYRGIDQFAIHNKPA